MTLARPTIGTNAASYTGFSAEGVTKNDDDSYTVHLTMGRNIVCLTDAAGKSTYQVMTVKSCHRDIMVNDEVVTSVKPGDAVTIQYSGLYHPANKLAGIHNFNAFLSYKKATDGVTVKNGKGNQYTMAATPTAQAVTFTVPEDWTSPVIELSDGVMGIGGFGDPVGNHRATSKDTGRAPNFTAISQSAVLGRVPAVTINVSELRIAGFENLELAAESHMSVSTEDDDDRTEFTSGDFKFATGCMHDYDYWYWFGYANHTDTTYKALADQWKNVVGGGYNKSKNYGVAYAAAFNGPCYVTVLNHDSIAVPGFYITNSAYAYSSMTKGDGFAKKFGKGDWFKLTIKGYSANDSLIGTKDYYLADLRDPKTAYIINDWRYVDLSGLGKVSKLGFELSSSDNGDYGMNTPAYFCFDNFGAEGTEILPEKNVEFPLEIATFEDIELAEESHMSISTEADEERTEFVSGDFEFSTGCMVDWVSWWFFGYANQTDTTYTTLDDQWKNVVGGGYDGSKNYGVAYASSYYGPCTVTILNHDSIDVPGFYITNSAYAYSSMKNGDSFAKKFGKGDWFKLTIKGYNAEDSLTGTKEFYLADLRDPKTAYIINDWRYVDLSGLGKVSKLGFELSSSDNGEWGMNTPAYFCFDNFGTEGTEVLPEKNVEFPLEIATFEDVNVETESFSKGATGYTTLTSGSYQFDVYCDDTYGTPYYYAFCTANYTGNTYTNDNNGLKNVVGGGYDGSNNYGAFFYNYYGQNAVTVLSDNDEGAVVPGFYITNSAYAYTSMLNGDAYSKQFTKGDWFKLTITGYNAEDSLTGTKEFYLADLREETTAYIINDWRYVDLSGLGKVSKLGFELSSSDTGEYGMNTPAYFCFDNFGAEGTEVLPEKNIETAITDFTVAKTQPTGYYDLKGVNTGKIRKGMNIVRMPDGSVRKIFVR